jgi:hypothetical protein
VRRGERPADHDLGVAVGRGGPAAAGRAGQDRCLPGRRALHRAVAAAGRPSAGPAVGAGRPPAAAAGPQAPLRAGLCAPVPGGRRLDQLAALCRIALDRPVPHPTTLVKLVRRAGPEVVEQLHTALVAKLAEGRLLRAGKLRVDTTVVEADIDHPTDADLLEHAVPKLGGLVRRGKGRGVASRTRFRDRGRAAGRRMQQLARTLRRPRGVAMAEVDRLTAQVARIAGRRCARCRWWPATPAGRWPADPAMTAWSAGRRAGGDDRCDRAAVGPDRPAPGRQPGDPRSAGVAGRSRCPPHPQGQARPARRVRRHAAAGRDERGLGADPSSSGATHRTRRSWSRRSVGSSASPAGRPGRWWVTVGSAPPPTTRPWPSLGSGGSAGKAMAGRARRGWRWSGPTVPAAGHLAGRHRGPEQPPQTLLRAAADPAAPAGRCPHRGRAGDLRLQPAADDGGRRRIRAQAANLPTSTAAATHQDFFRSK